MTTNTPDFGIPFHTHTEYQVMAAATLRGYQDGDIHEDTIRGLLTLGLRARDDGLRKLNTPGGGGKKVNAAERARQEGRLAVADWEDGIARGDLGPTTGLADIDDHARKGHE